MKTVSSSRILKHFSKRGSDLFETTKEELNLADGDEFIVATLLDTLIIASKKARHQMIKEYVALARLSSTTENRKKWEDIKEATAWNKLSPSEKTKRRREIEEHERVVQKQIKTHKIQMEKHG